MIMSLLGVKVTQASKDWGLSELKSWWSRRIEIQRLDRNQRLLLLTYWSARSKTALLCFLVSSRWR